jgi:predicted secreted protein
VSLNTKEITVQQKKHFGDLDDLKAMVRGCGRSGKWREILDREQYRFEGYNGEIVNWWPHRGTVQVQGQDQAALGRQLARKLQQSEELFSPTSRTQHTLRLRDRAVGRPRVAASKKALIAAAKEDLAEKLGKRFDQISIFVEL